MSKANSWIKFSCKRQEFWESSFPEFWLRGDANWDIAVAYDESFGDWIGRAGACARVEAGEVGAYHPHVVRAGERRDRRGAAGRQFGVGPVCQDPRRGFAGLARTCTGAAAGSHGRRAG